MYVKNISGKPIGIGSLTLLPNESGELPKGYGEKHPVIVYYLGRKYLKQAGKDDKPKKETAAQKKAREQAEAKAKAKLLEETRSLLGNMTLEELKDESQKYEIVVTDEDTDETIIQKIVEKIS